MAKQPVMDTDEIDSGTCCSGFRPRLLTMRWIVSVTESPFQADTCPELKEVEATIRMSLQTQSSGLQEMIVHLLQAGGKKLRPLLVLLCAGLSGGEMYSIKRVELLRVAAAVEMIHTASLVHDDIIDGAASRRGRETLHFRWDTKKAVLAGDFLLARAFDLLCGLEQKGSLLPLFARSVALMCQGEIRQLAGNYCWETSEKNYFHFNYLKTAQFLASCCEAGATVMKAGEGEIKNLRRYGFYLGQAFQIVDDILDYTADPVKLGKPVGKDLRQGTVTLPLIYLLRVDHRYRHLLRAASTRRPALAAHLQEQVDRAVRASGALQYASRRAARAGEAAINALQRFPPTRSRQLLKQIAEAIAGRVAFVKGQQ